MFHADNMIWIEINCSHRELRFFCFASFVPFIRSHVCDFMYFVKLKMYWWLIFVSILLLLTLIKYLILFLLLLFSWKSTTKNRRDFHVKHKSWMQFKCLPFLLLLLVLLPQSMCNVHYLNIKMDFLLLLLLLLFSLDIKTFETSILFTQHHCFSICISRILKRYNSNAMAFKLGALLRVCRSIQFLEHYGHGELYSTTK